MMGGGVEATIMNHYRFLDHEQVQFDFIVQDDSDNIPVKDISKAGGRIYTVPSYKNLPRYIASCEKLFSRIHPDIVHSNMNALSVFPLQAAKRAGIPIRIAHSHSTDNPNEFVKTAAKTFLRPFSRVYPTHLVACGFLSAEWLFGKKTVHDGDVHYIRNAIDLQRFVFTDTKRDELRKSINVSKNQFVIGQIGRFSTQKNQTFSIDILQRLLQIIPDAVLVFLGIGDTMDAVKEKVARLGLEHHVRFMGLRHDANSWYSAFDALLFPSLYEGLPLTIIEAQAAGLPIVASDHVTKEAFVNKQLITTVALKSSPEVWARTLADTFNKTGKRAGIDHTTVLKEAGYEIRDSARDMQQWYQQIMS
ncbi:glycosyltransferase [Bifidobacterium choerinum]|nr:glycosyltransferase [Bifidobacterium choerinum]